jgi:molybdopterin synthase catalytic subunit
MLFDDLARCHPKLGEMAGSIVMARNQEFAGRAEPVQEGDEVAFLPPVSGGSTGNYFALTQHTIDTRALAAHLLTGAEGAVVTFEGTVRNHTGSRRTRCLDYECYAPMALKVMTEIGEEIARSHAIERIAMVHRLGRMLIGETSVAVVVLAEHRRAAFEAALEGINRLKKRVPIWKKEHFADGEVWVEGEWDADVPVAGGR